MSRPHHNSSPNRSSPTNPRSLHMISPVRSMIISVQLSDIPAFSLGPSLYEYVHASTDGSSSFDSGSPPSTLPPDPVSTDNHSNPNSISRGDHPIHLAVTGIHQPVQQQVDLPNSFSPQIPQSDPSFNSGRDTTDLRKNI